MSAQSSPTGVMSMLLVNILRDLTSAFVRLDLKETGKNALVRKSYYHFKRCHLQLTETLS